LLAACLPCLLGVASAQTQTTAHARTQHSLRGYEMGSHSASYGYMYDNPRTLDNDALDEWGTVHEKVDLVRGSRGLHDYEAEGTYNKGMVRDEGNMAFNTDNPSTGRPGGTGSFTVTATQSSDLANSPAAIVAIDGNTDDQWNSGTCTHTTRETDPWWKLDMGEDRTVTEVRLYNLGGHQKYKMEHIEVRVGANGDATDALCGERLGLVQEANNHHVLQPFPTRHTVDTGGVVRVPCPQLPTAPTQPPTGQATRGGGLNGRYVTVTVIGAAKVLHLCEVHVMGSLLMAPAIDQGGQRRYDLDQGGGVPIDPCAVDMRMQSSGVARLCHD